MSYRAGFVGLVGWPNAGKSTLMNFLVAEKVSIVSSKPQTTRRRVLGLHSVQEGQIVFVDSPGIISTQSGLNAFLAREADEVIKDSDVLVLVMGLDTPSREEAEKLIEKVKTSGKPWLAVLTKTDLTDKSHRHLWMKEQIEKAGARVFSMSLKKDDADRKSDKEQLLKSLIEMLPASAQPLHDVELFTPENVRDLVSEIIREKCFEFLFEEIPFSLAVRVIKFDETKAIPHLAYEVMVAKENHKAIVIGKQGANLKKIGTEARKEIEKLLGQKVYLDLKVSFQKDWFKNQRVMKELGYVHSDN